MDSILLVHLVSPQTQTFVPLSLLMNKEQYYNSARTFKFVFFIASLSDKYCAKLLEDEAMRSLDSCTSFPTTVWRVVSTKIAKQKEKTEESDWKL